MPSGNTSAKPISEEQAVHAVLVAQRPVVFVDTCCLGDIFRWVLDGKGDAVANTLHAMLSNADNKYCYYVFPEQVVKEFNLPDQFIRRELDPFRTPLEKWNNAVRVSNDRRTYLLKDSTCDFQMLDIARVEELYSLVKTRISSLFDLGMIVAASSDAEKWCCKRLRDVLRPAQRGKSSYGDCIICGSMLSIVRKLRAGNFTDGIYFASSNDADYLQGSQLHPDLQLDFNAGGIRYSRSILDAYGQIKKKIMSSLTNKGKGLGKEVAALKEYKQCLITDVVTGQLKVDGK